MDMDQSESGSSDGMYMMSGGHQQQQQTMHQHLQQQDLGQQHNMHQNLELSDKFEKLRLRTRELDAHLMELQQDQEKFVIQWQNWQKSNAYLNSPPAEMAREVVLKMQKENQTFGTLIKSKAGEILLKRDGWIIKYQENYSLITELQQKVIDEELTEWKRGQQLGGNGGSDINSSSAKLELIQSWCEILAEAIWSTFQQLRKMSMICSNLQLQQQRYACLDQYQEDVQGLLAGIVKSTFMIEKQPPQVMKTNTRFTSTVRLLVGVQLNVHMTPPQVRVSIISESQAKSFLQNQDRDMSRDVSGNIVNNSGTMEYHQGSRQLTANFRNMQLQKIKRAEKKGTESVMDEKFALLFQSEFRLGGSDFVFKVATLSLPVVVIVHGNQEPDAWATVTWDNAFAAPNFTPVAAAAAPTVVSQSYNSYMSDMSSNSSGTSSTSQVNSSISLIFASGQLQGRLPFSVPDKVPWIRVGEVLSMKFMASVGSRDLNSESLRFLAGKVFRNSQVLDYDHMLLSWNQFSKEPLPDRTFTFWAWFYSILKVTREHLRGLWNDGTIYGFISRKQTEELLAQCSPGTFLLRYSDSELGGVSIAWLSETSEGSSEVLMVQPFTSRDFQIRGLADRINDLKNLTFLYPNIPKDQAFSKYYTPMNDQPQPNGYVKPMLALTLPSLHSSTESNPGTPFSGIQFQHSPPDMNEYGYGSQSGSQDVMHGFKASGVGYAGEGSAAAHSAMMFHNQIPTVQHNH